jgi:hypothetical protein|tara:strand:+ start:5238 stop:5402 length:165 start_codon:yes stop_codon:yes gene_type:complete
MKNELWGKYVNDGWGEWEYIDTANEDNPKEFLLREYRMAFGSGWQFAWRKEGEA